MMFQTNNFRLRKLSLSTLCALFAVTLAMVFFVASTAPLGAQVKLEPAQQKSMAQCLVGCKKGDANCQNSCTNKNASPAFFSSAGSCVRACADALAGAGASDQTRVDDLVQCVRACN